MFGKYTSQQVADNERYTQECGKIYHSFRIAEVKETEVKEAAIPILSSLVFLLFVMAFTVCTVRIKVYGDMDGDESLIFIYLYILLAVFALSAAVWIGFSLNVRHRGGDRSYRCYLYRDQAGLFAIGTVEKAGGTAIAQIVNCDRLLCFDGYEKDDMEWYGHKFERYSGMKQFVISPDAVFSDTDQSFIPYKNKLKKKITKGNTVVYRFYNSQGVVIGARYSHCLVLKDGKLQYAVAHYLRRYTTKAGFHHRNVKHTYSHIDDETVKIVFSREFLENARKEKFVLPQPSVNIIYEDSE